MLKRFSVLIVVAFIFCLIGHPALAKNPSGQAGKPDKTVNPAAEKGLSEQPTKIDHSPGPKGPSGRAGKSNIAHLYLHEKDPDTWKIIEDGAWGKMKYNLSGSVFSFVFNGHDLVPGSIYTLIYYQDPWPGTNLICLGTAEADEFGNVHIKNIVETGDLPPPATDETDHVGAKIWLVLFPDVQCGEAGTTSEMIGWNPTDYLFEYETIYFDDTEDDTEDDGEDE